MNVCCEPSLPAVRGVGDAARYSCQAACFRAGLCGAHASRSLDAVRSFEAVRRAEIVLPYSGSVDRVSTASQRCWRRTWVDGKTAGVASVPPAAKELVRGKGLDAVGLRTARQPSMQRSDLRRFGH